MCLTSDTSPTEQKHIIHPQLGNILFRYDNGNLKIPNMQPSTDLHPILVIIACSTISFAPPSCTTAQCDTHHTNLHTALHAANDFDSQLAIHRCLQNRILVTALVAKQIRGRGQCQSQASVLLQIFQLTWMWGTDSMCWLQTVCASQAVRSGMSWGVIPICVRPAWRAAWLSLHHIQFSIPAPQNKRRKQARARAVEKVFPAVQWMHHI